MGLKQPPLWLDVDCQHNLLMGAWNFVPFCYKEMSSCVPNNCQIVEHTCGIYPLTPDNKLLNKTK